jgi:hypothetical protein
VYLLLGFRNTLGGWIRELAITFIQFLLTVTERIVAEACLLIQQTFIGFTKC